MTEDSRRDADVAVQGIRGWENVGSVDRLDQIDNSRPMPKRLL